MSAEYNITGIGSAIHSDTYRDDPTFRAMINDIVITYFDSDECDGIYGYMYGTPYGIAINDDGSTRHVPEKIIDIPKRLIKKHDDCFAYIYGWPGPDINIYTFDDYGITWAFEKEEIKKLSAKEWEEYECKNQQDV